MQKENKFFFSFSSESNFETSFKVTLATPHFSPSGKRRLAETIVIGNKICPLFDLEHYFLDVFLNIVRGYVVYWQ